jgi:hypothetical protein
MQPDQKDGSLSTAAVREKIKQVEADLADQGLALFPNTKAGEHARILWLRIRTHLLRGGSVDVKCSPLNLAWHRMEVKRARDILLQMGLVRPRPDGRYVLGRYDRLDELSREAIMDVKLLEGVLVGLSGFLQKSKTQ